MVDAQASESFNQWFACGIDLGTSNSAAYVQNGNQAPRCVLMGSDRTIPSEVSFGSEIAVGKRARSLASKKNSPAQLVKLVKYLIGKRCSQITDKQKNDFKNMFGAEIDYSHADDVPRLIVTHQGKKQAYRPENISAFVLGHIKDAVMQEFNVTKEMLGDKHLQVVISVPAHFFTNERNCTKDAGVIAGLDVLRIIPEPTAAIMSATYLKLLKEPQGAESNTILVVDLGGGTFDVSMAQQHQDNLIEILGTDGDVMLGGADFTHAVAVQLAEFFCEQYPDYNANELISDKKIYKKFWKAAEDAKIAVNLQNADRTEVSLVIHDNEFEFDYTLKYFNKVFAPFAKRILETIERLLKTLERSIHDLTSIILVGGSCRIKAITTLLQDMGARDAQINKELNFDEAVAMGACCQAWNAGKYSGGRENNLLLIDCVPANINIRTDSDTAHTLIKANQTIPFQKSEVFSTGQDNQDGVTIHVSEGPYSVASKNTKVGEFHLQGIERAKRGVPQIEVCFDVDHNGILKVSAKDKKTGVAKEIKVEDDRMTPEQVKKATDEYEAHKEEDEKHGKLLNLKSQCTSMCQDMEDQLESRKDHPKHAEAARKVNDLLVEMRGLSGSNILEKDENYFMNAMNNLRTDAVIEEVLKAGPAAPDMNNNMPAGVPGPAVDEAD